MLSAIVPIALNLSVTIAYSYPTHIKEPLAAALT
jgi:hypothetical protein